MTCLLACRKNGSGPGTSRSLRKPMWPMRPNGYDIEQDEEQQHHFLMLNLPLLRRYALLCYLFALLCYLSVVLFISDALPFIHDVMLFICDAMLFFMMLCYVFVVLYYYTIAILCYLTFCYTTQCSPCYQRLLFSRHLLLHTCFYPHDLDALSSFYSKTRCNLKHSGSRIRSLSRREVMSSRLAAQSSSALCCLLFFIPLHHSCQRLLAKITKMRHTS